MIWLRVDAMNDRGERIYVVLASVIRWPREVFARVDGGPGSTATVRKEPDGRVMIWIDGDWRDVEGCEVELSTLNRPEIEDLLEWLKDRPERPVGGRGARVRSRRGFRATEMR